jgi:hypothetical protein
VALAAGLLLLGFAIAPAGARAVNRYCGKVNGVPVHAHNVSCRAARHVYRADMAGNVPPGWICSASLARCYKGDFDSGRYMWWRRTVYRPLAGTVVLGGEIYGGDYGEGWGTVRPHTIYNGGVPSGLIRNVHWSSWGGEVARGRGRHAIYKPHGGYYRHAVVARLKAVRIGSCERRNAYLKLLVREPRRPGGPLGPWYSWSGPQTICEPYGSYLRAQDPTP